MRELEFNALQRRLGVVTVTAGDMVVARWPSWWLMCWQC